jgi:hypothetical protein
MSFLKDLLGIKPKPVATLEVGAYTMPKDRVHKVHAELVDEKYKDFHVTFFPYSRKYKAAYKGKYLWRWYSTGLIEVDTEDTGSTLLATEEQAWHLIDQFIEQQQFPGSHIVIIKR